MYCTVWVCFPRRRKHWGVEFASCHLSPGPSVCCVSLNNSCKVDGRLFCDNVALRKKRGAKTVQIHPNLRESPWRVHWKDNSGIPDCFRTLLTSPLSSELNRSQEGVKLKGKKRQNMKIMVLLCLPTVQYHCLLWFSISDQRFFRMHILCRECPVSAKSKQATWSFEMDKGRHANCERVHKDQAAYGR